MRVPAVACSEMPSGTDENDTLYDLTPSEHYVVLRKAVQDGIVGAVGTIILVVLGLYLIFFGVMIAVSGGTTAIVQAAGGVVIIIVGGYFTLSALGFIRPVEKYFG
jgi:hypothetical protein